jgi:N-acyl-D-aspartate/D-glutamate deacylase
MQSLVEIAMKNGALGMTTALIYPPSSYAATSELIEMAKVAAKYGGIYATHMRGEGAELLQSIQEAITIGETGRAAGGNFPFESRLPAGLGQADGGSRQTHRAGALARRGRGG